MSCARRVAFNSLQGDCLFSPRPECPLPNDTQPLTLTYAAPMSRSSRIESLAARYDELKRLEHTVVDALLQEFKDTEVELTQNPSKLRETETQLKTTKSKLIHATAKRDVSEKALIQGLREGCQMCQH